MKLVLISALPRRIGSRIVKISSMPSGIPSQSRQDAERLSRRSQSKAVSSFSNQASIALVPRDRRVRL
jgi:hypothetical protein